MHCVSSYRHMSATKTMLAAIVLPMSICFWLQIILCYFVFLVYDVQIKDKIDILVKVNIFSFLLSIVLPTIISLGWGIRELYGPCWSRIVKIHFLSITFFMLITLLLFIPIGYYLYPQIMPLDMVMTLSNIFYFLLISICLYHINTKISVKIIAISIAGILLILHFSEKQYAIAFLNHLQLCTGLYTFRTGKPEWNLATGLSGHMFFLWFSQFPWMIIIGNVMLILYAIFLVKTRILKLFLASVFFMGISIYTLNFSNAMIMQRRNSNLLDGLTSMKLKFMEPQTIFLPTKNTKLLNCIAQQEIMATGSNSKEFLNFLKEIMDCFSKNEFLEIPDKWSCTKKEYDLFTDVSFRMKKILSHHQDTLTADDFSFSLSYWMSVYRGYTLNYFMTSRVIKLIETHMCDFYEVLDILAGKKYHDPEKQKIVDDAIKNSYFEIMDLEALFMTKQMCNSIWDLDFLMRCQDDVGISIYNSRFIFPIYWFIFERDVAKLANQCYRIPHSLAVKDGYVMVNRDLPPITQKFLLQSLRTRGKLHSLISQGISSVK